ncbi:MAG: GxxExxY protein [Kiritimatiellales bacterium]
MDYPEKDLTEKIIGAAIEVHKYWGPGLIESVYEKSLVRELELRGIEYKQQVDLPLEYKGVQVGDGLRLDLIVEGKVVVELKVVKDFDPVHESQLLTYMRITNCKVGLLINFNKPTLRDGVKRYVI